MSVFRRRQPDPVPTPETSDPAAPAAAPRDADLALPPFRPKETPGMALPPRPTAPPPAAAAPRPGLPPAAAARPEERRTLVVGKGISLQGTVADAERLVVEGTVESKMIQAVELQVAHAGVFKGEVQVEDAEIAGTFDGSLTATGNLIIRATGKVIGTARYRRLQVEDGGVISGRMEMLTDAPAPPVRAGAEPALSFPAPGED
ncbi:MAG: polymer-forming cytoskeletal protein [Acetobacteraceae bacterium]